jgi:hypothetical protein
MKTTTKCTCNNEACAIREARGLTAFCQMPRGGAVERTGFRSIEEAYAANPGRKVGILSGGLHTGMSARFGAL